MSLGTVRWGHAHAGGTPVRILVALCATTSPCALTSTKSCFFFIVIISLMHASSFAAVLEVENCCPVFLCRKLVHVGDFGVYEQSELFHEAFQLNSELFRLQGV